MGNVTIRPADISDIGRITAIYGHSVLNGTATYELTPPDEAEMATRLVHYTGRGFPWFVADLDSHAVGYAYAAPFRERRAYRFTVEDSIYIDPSAQGRGIGMLLLKKLIEKTTEMGFRQLIAVIGDGSPQSASVRLHEKAGFLHSGAITGTGYKHDRWLDTVFMQLPLNEGNTAPPDPDSIPERRFQAEGKG